MITVITTDPSGLLASIKEGIREYKIRTWGIVPIKNVDYFTHTAEQWNEKAFLESTVFSNQLQFELNWYKDNEPDIYTKGVYQGRFIEMLCNHFGDKFSSINTVLP